MRPAGQLYLVFVSMRFLRASFWQARVRRSLAGVLLGAVPGLTGCLSHVRTVQKTRVPDVVLGASLEDLSKQVNAQFDSVQTLNATVEITASTGGGLQGQVKDYPAFSGYIFLQKPESMRVLLLVPVLRSQAVDMVSDGKTWKLWIPPRNKAMEGTSEVTQPSKNGLENLRPAVFFDSLLVKGPSAEEYVSLTSDVRLLESGKKKDDIIEQPDYDMEILSKPEGQRIRTLRVIHISRADLLPYQQDIYDDAGHVVTKAVYSQYQKSGDTEFPQKIVIERPLDHYSLTIAVTKLTLNQKLDPDQFDLKIPDGVPVQEMK